MKNLFKNLMLVAVAAMAFTACEKDLVNGGDEQNAEARSFKFYATFADDTRSGFAEKEEGATAYKSEWFGDETICITHTSYCYGDGVNLVDNTTSGGNATFDVEFAGQDPNNGAEIVAVSPASAWTVSSVYDFSISYGPIGWKHSFTIPTTQTPSANSVDAAAHILKAVTTFDGNNNIALSFEHQVAYGKLSLKNFAGAGVTSYTLDINGDKYVINSANTTDVWFACEPAVVENMTIIVNVTEGSYTKTLVENGNKPLEFKKGRVSTFGVDMTDSAFGEVVETFNPDKLYDTLVWDNSNTRFKLTGAGVSELRIYLNSANRPGNNSIVADTYTGCGSNNPQAGKFGAEIRSEGIYVSSIGSSSTLEVSIADGKYVILLTHNSTTYGYKGLPDGWSVPGGGTPEPEPDPDPVQLATPSATATVITAESITVSWDAVANASGYAVAINGGAPESVNALTYTFEGLNANTDYVITVVAKGNGTDYLDSAAATVNAKTSPAAGGGEDPAQSVAITKLALPNYDGKYLSFNDDKLTMQLSWPQKYNPNGTYTLVVGSSSTSATAHSIKVDGNDASSVSGTITVEYQQYGQYLFIVTFNNVVIDGVSYTGSASTPF